MLFANMKLKLSVIILLLSVLSSSFAQVFTLEKVDDIYKTEYFRKLVRYEDKILAIGERALHLLINDNEGNLIKLDDLPLWGHLDLYHTSLYGSLEIIGNNVFLYGFELGEFIRTRLYKVEIEANTINLVNSLNFYDEPINQVLAVNNHLFVRHFNTLSVFESEEMEVVTEYDLPSFFHISSSKFIYKISEQYVFTWDQDIDELMHIYDVSDVCNIEEITQIDFNIVFPDVIIDLPIMINDTTLCMCNTEVFSFFDVSNIFDWNYLSSINFNSTPAMNNLSILDENNIIIPLQNGIVNLYDISNIEDPELLSTISSVCVDNYDGCTSIGNNFYRVENGFGIHQYRIENSQIIYNDHYPLFNQASYTFTHNNILAVSSKFWQGIHFFNMTDLNDIEYICSHFDNYFQYRFDFEDNLLAVPLVSYPDFNCNIDIYDISDIENLSLVNRIENIFAEEVYLEYPYLYTRESIPASYDYHFVKYDISQPFSPQVIYNYQLPNDCRYGNFKYGNHYYYKDEETIIVLGNLDGNYPDVIETLEFNDMQYFRQCNEGYLSLIKTVSTNITEGEIYSLEDPLSPEFILDYPFTFESHHVGINNNLFFQGGFTINVFDIENGYNLNESIHSFEMPFHTGDRYFFERDNENYVLLKAATGISLYKYDYDNSFMFENEIHCNRINLSNYPNPFNPETTISFSVTQNSDFVNLDIYNIKGQKIKSFPINQLSSSQVHQVIWDGTDSSNKPVSSGIYMYQLKVNGKAIVSKKCLLLK